MCEKRKKEVKFRVHGQGSRDCRNQWSTIGLTPPREGSRKSSDFQKYVIMGAAGEMLAILGQNPAF